MAVAPPVPASSGIGRGVRLFHWLSAALLTAAFCLAWSFEALGPGEASGQLVTLHRSIGLTLLGVTVLRLVWRGFHPLPPLGESLAWERWLAGGVQALLYCGLFAQPFVGWAASGAQGDSVSLFGMPLPDLLDPDPDRADQLFALHKGLGWAIVGLVALHVAGAVRHAVHRDGVVGRMVWGNPSPDIMAN